MFRIAEKSYFPGSYAGVMASPDIPGPLEVDIAYGFHPHVPMDMESVIGAFEFKRDGNIWNASVVKLVEPESAGGGTAYAPQRTSYLVRLSTFCGRASVAVSAGFPYDAYEADVPHVFPEYWQPLALAIMHGDRKEIEGSVLFDAAQWLVSYHRALAQRQEFCISGLTLTRQGRDVLLNAWHGPDRPLRADIGPGDKVRLRVSGMLHEISAFACSERSEDEPCPGCVLEVYQQEMDGSSSCLSSNAGTDGIAEAEFSVNNPQAIRFMLIYDKVAYGSVEGVIYQRTGREIEARLDSKEKRAAYSEVSVNPTRMLDHLAHDLVNSYDPDHNRLLNFGGPGMHLGPSDADAEDASLLSLAPLEGVNDEYLAAFLKCMPAKASRGRRLAASDGREISASMAARSTPPSTLWDRTMAYNLIELVKTGHESEAGRLCDELSRRIKLSDLPSMFVADRTHAWREDSAARATMAIAAVALGRACRAEMAMYLMERACAEAGSMDNLTDLCVVMAAAAAFGREGYEIKGFDMDAARRMAADMLNRGGYAYGLRERLWYYMSLLGKHLWHF